MAVTTEEVILYLREGIGAKQADLLIDWMQGVEARLDAAGTAASVTALSSTLTTVVDDLHAVAAKLDADAGVTDEDYVTTLTTPANE